jgi:hypothetical protein
MPEGQQLAILSAQRKGFPQHQKFGEQYQDQDVEARGIGLPAPIPSPRRDAGVPISRRVGSRVLAISCGAPLVGRLRREHHHLRPGPRADADRAPHPARALAIMELAAFGRITF